MKKILALTLSLCLILGLAACGGSTDTTTAAPETTKAQDQTTAAPETTKAPETTAAPLRRSRSAWSPT